MAVRNSDPKPGHWEADVAQWRSSRPAVSATESLHGASGVALDGLPADNRLSLEDEAATEKFLTAWAEALAAGSLPVPLVMLPKPPMSASTRRAITVGAALAALVVCITGQLLLNAFLSRRIRETARLRTPAQQLAQLKSETDKLQKQKAELSAACKTLQDDLDHYQQARRAQQQRLASLLGVLARRSPSQTVIRKIDGNQDGIVLHGLCLDLQSPDALASGLAKDLTEALGRRAGRCSCPASTRMRCSPPAGRGNSSSASRIPGPKSRNYRTPRGRQARAGDKNHETDRPREISPAGGARGRHPGRIRLVVQSIPASETSGDRERLPSGRGRGRQDWKA